MVAAMKIWNEALGCNKGIAFYHDIPDCPPYKILPNIPHARLVSIEVDPDMKEGGSSTLGCPNDSGAVIRIPPKTKYPLNGYSYRDMLVHELGL